MAMYKTMTATESPSESVVKRYSVVAVRGRGAAASSAGPSVLVDKRGVYSSARVGSGGAAAATVVLVRGVLCLGGEAGVGDAG